MAGQAQPEGASGSVLGIDTHKLTHVAAIVDGLGRMQGTFTFAATDAGTIALLTWAAAHGSPQAAGVEGTGSYGYQLTRALQRSRASPCSKSTDPIGPIVGARARAIQSMPKQLRGRCCPGRPPRYPRTVKDPSNPHVR